MYPGHSRIDRECLKNLATHPTSARQTHMENFFHGRNRGKLIFPGIYAIKLNYDYERERESKLHVKSKK